MVTPRGNTSLDKRLTGQYRRLFRNLGLLMLVIVALATGAVAYFDKRQVEDLSRELIASTAATVVAQLTSFFKTEDNNLRTAVEQLQMTQVQGDLVMKDLFSLLSPFLNPYQNASGILLAELNADNDYYGILKTNPDQSEFQVRTHFAQEWGRGKALLERWKDGQLLESWFRKDDFNIRARPWYENAREAAENEIVATEPYLFYKINKQGITLSTRWRKRDTDRQFILAIDILLSDITRITQAMRPTDNGVVFVLTHDLRLVGLPADERFENENAVYANLLKPLSEVDMPVLQTGVSEWERHGRVRTAFPFEADGRNWWAGFEWIEDHPKHAGFWTGILVPESDFLGALSLQRNFSLAAIAGLGLVLGLFLIVGNVRKIRHEVREAVAHIGQKLGPFELLYKIGDGGNGTVYRANHALLKRPTAVKVMLPQFASSESAKQRFIREVQLTSRLTHPNTVAIYDFGQTPEGTLYYAMEHLNGVSLDDLVRISGPQPAARVLHILHHVCGSLDEAHGQGLIHRDVKPANIMLCERGGLHDVVKVLDFGLVKEIQEDQQQQPEEDNAVVGTPFYLAPELISDASVFSPLSDLYALGGVAYFLLTGHNVFEGASAMQICEMHLNDAPPPPSQRVTLSVPSDLEAIVMQCLAKEPARRPQSAGAMSVMLARCGDFDAWTEQQAQKWWAENRSTLPVEAHEDTHSPLSDTQMLIEPNSRTRP
jgi:serine/threonine-protein kinase